MPSGTPPPHPPHLAAQVGEEGGAQAFGRVRGGGSA